MKIEIWSDVVCPWCYIGIRNLELALASFAHAGEVELVFRAFELDPKAPAEREGSYVAHLAHKYGMDEWEARAWLDRMVASGAEAGVTLRFDDIRAGNSFDAHRLLLLGREAGVQLGLAERLFAATFTEGRPIGDRDTLVALAVEVGIPEADARRTLDGDGFAAEVRAEEAEAAALRVEGVPFFLVDRRLALSGGRPPETLLRFLDHAWTATASAAPGHQ